MANALFAAVPIAPLVYFRIAFGLLMAWEAWRYTQYDWVLEDFANPIQFKYYGFGWVRPWPDKWLYVQVYALGVLGLLTAAGVAYRLSALLFFLGWTYLFLLDQANYLNHMYLICLISGLMVVLPAHRAASVDAWLRPRLRGDMAPAWTFYLLRFQFALVYIFGGLAKLNADWLAGEPMRTWMRGTNYPIVGTLLGTEPAVYVLSYGGLLLDLLIVPALFWRRTRVAAIVVGIVFHLMNALMFRIGVFPWIMIATMPLFMPLPWWQRINARWFNARTATTTAAAAAAERVRTFVGSRRRNIVMAVLLAYVVIQLSLPMRQAFYPGPTSWTEQGHRFSWRMKLRTKRGEVRYVVSHPKSTTVIEIDPAKFLTKRQAQKMQTHPDMILQMAHWLAREYEGRGFPGVEVRALTYTTLNGREPQPLVDSSVNLAAERRTLARAKWIVPLMEPLRVDPLPWKPPKPASRDPQADEKDAQTSEEQDT